MVKFEVCPISNLHERIWQDRCSCTAFHVTFLESLTHIYSHAIHVRSGVDSVTTIDSNVNYDQRSDKYAGVQRFVS